jgi:hypothetical protein
MKKRILWSVGVLLCLSYVARGQTINRLEYYINSDPGVGNGTPVSFTAGSSVTHTFTASLPAGLPEGFHWLGVRARDANGQWSTTTVRPFTREEIKTPLPLPLLAGIEYFLDDDPGYGLGTPIAVPSGSTATVTFAVALPANLPDGFHFLTIRTRDINNRWAVAVVRPFLKQQVIPPDPAAALLAMEYFLDQDPGAGQGTPIALPPGQEANGINFMIPLSQNLPEGTHHLTVRVKDSNQRWSIATVKSFYKMGTTLPPLPNLARLEYFIDHDPGTGAGIPISFTPGTTAPAINFNADLTGLANGTHFLMLRAMDAQGHWSLIATREFSVCTSAIVAAITPSGPLTLCQGGNVQLAVPGGFATYQWYLNGQPIGGATNSTYQASQDGEYIVTITNNSGCTSTTSSVQVKVISTPTMASTDQSICPGGKAVLSVAGCSGMVSWSHGATGASIEVSPTSTTTYTATCSAPGICTSNVSAPVTVTVNPAPAAPTLSGPGMVCPKTTATITASGCNGDILWSEGSTGTTLLVSPLATTVYTATCIPTEGCPSPASSPYTLTVSNSTAGNLVIISQSQTICQGGSVMLTTSGCTGIVTWSTGSTGSSLTVTPSTTTLYTATCTQNSCSVPAANSVQIKVNAAPAAPIMRSSSEAVCSGKAVALSASQCIGTISWSNGFIGSRQTVNPTQTTTYTATCTVNECTSPASTPVIITVSDCADPNVSITYMEYFLDQDPGHGAGSPVSITPNPVVQTSFIVNMNNATDGFHWLTVRARDGQGRWSESSTFPVYKIENPVTPPLKLMVRAEYFIDEDPGHGLGKQVNFTPATSINSASFNIALLDTLADGIHRLTIRTQDNSGKWSVSIVRQFVKETLVDPTTLQRVEFFVDTDPGFGNGTNIPLPVGGSPAGGTNPPAGVTEATLSAQPSMSGLASGTHRLYTRVMNSKGKWGVVGVSTFQVCNLPVTAILSTVGPATVCVGNTVKLKVTRGYTYQWLKNGEIINGAADSSLVASETGLYRVIVSNGTCSVTTNEISVQVNPGTIPLVPQIGPTNQTVCSQQTATISATGCAGGIITWSTNALGNQILVQPTATTQYTATCTINSCISQSSLPATVSLSAGPLICESTASGAWNDVSKWSCGHIPTSCDDVVLKTGHVISLGVEGKAKNLSIQGNAQLLYGLGGGLKLGAQ